MISNMLTFDVEEYFQVQAAAGCVARSDWENIPKRLEQSIDLILEILDQHKTKATFFILGWVAKHEMKLVKKIAAAEHEIASHGMSHYMLNILGREKFIQSLSDSKKLIEDLTGQQVNGFRAPTFSLTLKTAWAIDELKNAGFTYDSSVFPIHHDRYGVPDAPTTFHKAVSPEGAEILEIPPLTMNRFKMNIPIGGGGYFRLAPQWLIDHALKTAEKKNNPAMVYLHPWEFDPGQPALPMGKISKWRHRVNLDKTAAKLKHILKKFKFTTVKNNFETLNKTAEKYLYKFEVNKK